MYIDERYLVNFTEKEKKKFHQEQAQKDNDLAAYEGKLCHMVYSDSPDIFANHLIEYNSPLEVKYMLNRVLMDDPKCHSFQLTRGDGVKGMSVFDIGFAFANNTHCHNLELSGFKLKSFDLIWLLNALKKNKLESLNLAGNDFNDNALTYLLHQMVQPQNAWQNVKLGALSVDAEMQKKLKEQSRISFQVKPPKQPSKVCSFLQRLGQKVRV